MSGALQQLVPTMMPGVGRSVVKGVALPVAAALALGLVMQFVVGPMIGAYPASVALQVGISVMLAVSLNIVNGYTGQFSIGHAGFFAVGAYVGAGISYYAALAGIDPASGQQPSQALSNGAWLVWNDGQSFLFSYGEWRMVLASIVGGCVAAGLGYIVGLPSLRLRGDYLAIVTLGFGEITRVLLTQTKPQIFDRDELAATQAKDWVIPPMGGATGFSDIPAYASLMWVWFFVAVMIFFAYRVKQSSTGRALLSIREDEIAARSMGVNITKYKVRAFVLAAGLAGLAGSLYAHTGQVIRPQEAGFQRSFEVIIFVVLGGMGSISGVVLAAIILSILPEALRDLSEYRLIVYALLLILMMIVRPKGLFGVREIWEFWPFTRGKKNEKPNEKKEVAP